MSISKSQPHLRLFHVFSTSHGPALLLHNQSIKFIAQKSSIRARTRHRFAVQTLPLENCAPRKLPMLCTRALAHAILIAEIPIKRRSEGGQRGSESRASDAVAAARNRAAAAAAQTFPINASLVAHSMVAGRIVVSRSLSVGSCK